MKLSILVRAMADAGATVEAIALAVEAVEASIGGSQPTNFVRQRQNDERVWVYVMAEDNPMGELVKVGISQHPNHRMKTLEREWDRVLYLAHTEGPFRRSDAVAIERKAHEKLVDRREHGEWFHASAEEAVSVLQGCVPR